MYNLTEENFVNSLNIVKDYIQFSYMKQRYDLQDDFPIEKLKESMKYVNFIVSRINKKFNIQNNQKYHSVNINYKKDIKKDDCKIINVINASSDKDDFDEPVDKYYYDDEKFIVDNKNNITNKEAIRALTCIYLKNNLSLFTLRKRLREYFNQGQVWKETNNLVRGDSIDFDSIIKDCIKNIKERIYSNERYKRNKFKRVNLDLNKYYKYDIIDSVEVNFNNISMKDLKDLKFNKNENLISCIYVDMFGNDRFGKKKEYLSFPLRHDKFMMLKTAYQPYKTKDTIVNNYNYMINKFSSCFVNLPNFNLEKSKVRIVVLKKIDS